MAFFCTAFFLITSNYCKTLQVLDDGDESDEDSGAEDDSESEAVILSPESNAISAKVLSKLAVDFLRNPTTRRLWNTEPIPSLLRKIKAKD